MQSFFHRILHFRNRKCSCFSAKSNAWRYSEPRREYRCAQKPKSRGSAWSLLLFWWRINAPKSYAHLFKTRCFSYPNVQTGVSNHVMGYEHSFKLSYCDTLIIIFAIWCITFCLSDFLRHEICEQFVDCKDVLLWETGKV